MRRLLWIFLLVLAMEAHPGVGIVMDAQGRVYYTDLKQVCASRPLARWRT